MPELCTDTPWKKHQYEIGQDGVERCVVCLVSWREANSGFASNVTPPRQHKPPSSARP